MQYGFYYDNARCTGCRTCVLACRDYHDTPHGISYRKVYDYEGGSCRLASDGTCTTDAFAYHLSLACNHCAKPVCTQVCPTTAMHKESETGLVRVNTAVCIGCGYCTLACPYHAPALNPESGKSSKCDGCADRVAQGRRPICVDACPLRALEFGEIAELAMRHPGMVSAVPPMPDALVTGPNLLINPSPAALRDDASEGHIVNVDETNYVRM